MIRKSINSIFVCLVVLLSLYLIEGACFRLVEPYAKWRLNLSWGSPDSTRENPLLNKISLDHFHSLPGNSPVLGNRSGLMEDEIEYSQKITSFNRPLRDKYYSFVTKQVNPLRNFEIVDLGILKEVVLPGLRRPASPLDVELGLARRQGLPVGYAKGICAYVIQPGSRSAYEAKFAQLESAFSFLLGHGIACVLLNPESPDELFAKFKFLKNKYPNFSEKIFVLAEGKAAKTVDDTMRDRNGLLNCFIAKGPSEALTAERATSAWFMGILTDEEIEQSVENSLLQRVRLNRKHSNLYHSRLSGLLVKESEWEKLPFSSVSIAYILNCMEYFQHDDLASGITELSNELNQSTELTMLNLLEANFSDEVGIILDKGAESMDSKPNFECDVINEYRILNADDPEILNLSNRELVLQIGASFEEMGDDILLQIAERDPMFYRFYLSLKEIHKSQN